jgi:tetratricopeptide (TPR) repeat protein
VLAEQPSAEQVHYPLAQVLQRLGRSAEARSHFQDAARRALSVGGRPQCADPLDLELAELRTGAAAAMRRGMLLSLAGSAGEEVELLRAAIEQSPRDAALRQRLGAILLEAGNLEGAEEQLTEAVGLAPDDPEILVALGVTAARRQDFETAVDHFRAALGINPESVHYRMQLGQALRQLGRCQEAVERFTEVLDAEGTHRQALLQRSACLADLGRSREAGLDMARLLDSYPPDDLEERLRLASMLLSLGEDETALRHFRMVAESPAAPPVRAAAHLLIGQVQLRRGQDHAAGESFRIALSLDPRLADRLPRGR